MIEVWRINKRQISKIWAAAKERGIDRADVYDLVLQVSGQDSIKGMTQDQANKIIDRIVGTCSRPEYQKQGRITTDQMRKKIYMLTVELGWDKNPKRLEGFCKRLFKVEKVEWLDERQCYQLIETLKDMVKRKEQYK